MKKLILSVSFILLSVFSLAQSMAIDYQQIKHMKIGGDNPTETHKLMMQVYSRPTFFKLHVLQDKSLYQKQESIDNKQGKKYVMPVIGQINIKSVLTDYKNKTQLKELDYSKKEFMVLDSLQDFKWTLENEKINILGFSCRKATTKTESGMIIEAWYANKLPYKMGPLDYYGLPGIILKTISYPEKNPDGYVETLAINIEEEETPTDIINKFSKRDFITGQEFQNIVDEYSEKLKNMYGNGVDKD